MKKVYLTGAIMAFSGLIFAQTNLAQANMENYVLTANQNGIHPTHLANDNRAEGDEIVANDFSTAADWLNPVDANGNQWQIGTTFGPSQYTVIGAMASTTAANGYAAFDGITSLIDGTVTAQDAIVELDQTINCGGISGVVLEFEQRYGAFNSDETIVEVSGDGGTNWTEYLLNEDAVTNEAATQSTITLNVSAVAGNSANVRVRFRWRELGADPNYGSGYAWQIDDFKLIEAWNYESAMITPLYRMGVGMTYDQGLEYHMIPTAQISPIEFSCQIMNNGGMIQTGSNLSADVEFNAGNVFSDVSPSSDIALLATDSFVVATAFTPASGVGTYNVTMMANQTNTDVDLTNNEFTYSFEVTDHTFARDNGVESGSISNVSNNTGLSMSIGNVMNVFTNGEIGALDVKLSDDAANSGKVFYAAIYKLNAAGDGYDWVAQSNDHTVISANVNNFVRMPFESPVAVSAGEEILIVAGHYGDDVEFSYAQGTEDGTVLGFTDDGASLFSLTGASAIMVRADMRDFTGVEEVAVDNISVAQNVPNPFNGNTVVSYNLNEASNVSIEIIDVTGKVVSTINEGTQAAGEHNITIDGSTLAEGTYFYTFTAGEYKVTKRMVVSK